MKKWLIALLLLTLTGCAAKQQPHGEDRIYDTLHHLEKYCLDVGGVIASTIRPFSFEGRQGVLVLVQCGDGKRIELMFSEDIDATTY